MVTYADQLSLEDAVERVAGTEWHARALRSIDVLCKNYDTFTAEDLRTLAGDPPGSGNALGAMLKSLAQRNIIRPAGFVEAQRGEARGRAIRLWTAA